LLMFPVNRGRGEGKKKVEKSVMGVIGGA